MSSHPLSFRALNASSLAGLPWGSGAGGWVARGIPRCLLSGRTCLSPPSQGTGMLAQGPHFSPGSSAGCRCHQPLPPTQMSSRSMPMPKVVCLPSGAWAWAGWWGLLSGVHFLHFEMGSFCHLLPLFAKRMGGKTFLNCKGLCKLRASSLFEPQHSPGAEGDMAFLRPHRW